MGHYRSEMMSDDDHRKAEEAKRARLDASAAKIKAAIDQRGIEHVLAEMIADPTLFAVRFR